MSHSSPRRAPTRDPLTYATVSEWWADWAGFAPVQMAHHLSKLEQAGIPFPEAWRIGLSSGAIILVNPPDKQPWNRPTEG